MPARLTLALSLVVATTLAVRPTAAQENPIVLEGKHVRLTCDLPTPDAARAALKVAETTWTFAKGVFGRPRGKAPLEIHVHGDLDSYRTAERSATKGAYAEAVGFRHPDTNVIHIRTEPPCDASLIRRFGLPLETLRHLARLTARVAALRANPEHTGDGEWFLAGGAAWCAERALEKVKRIGKGSDDPHHSTVRHRCQRLLETGWLPDVAQILAGRFDGLDEAMTEAVHESFFEFLKSGPEKGHFAKFCKEIARAGQHDDRTALVNATFVKNIDPARAALVYKRWVGDAEVTWDEVASSLDPRAEGWLQGAPATHNAVAWRCAPVNRSSYVLSGRITLLAGESAQGNLLLDRDDRGFIQVSFAREVGVTVLHFDAGESRWQELGALTIDSLGIDQPLAFSVKVEGAKLTVAAGSGGPLTLDLGDRRLTGPWGVGALANSWVLWSDVAVEH